MSDKIIRLKKAKEVFPDKFTKIRREDLTNIVVDKKEYLTNHEEKALINFAREMDKKGHHEFFAIREGQRIKFRSID